MKKSDAEFAAIEDEIREMRDLLGGEDGKLSPPFSGRYPGTSLPRKQKRIRAN